VLPGAPGAIRAASAKRPQPFTTPIERSPHADGEAGALDDLDDLLAREPRFLSQSLLKVPRT
jgi:hypothetical protein